MSRWDLSPATNVTGRDGGDTWRRQSHVNTGTDRGSAASGAPGATRTPREAGRTPPAADTFISGLWNQKLNLHCFKPPGLWRSVSAATQNSQGTGRRSGAGPCARCSAHSKDPSSRPLSCPRRIARVYEEPGSRDLHILRLKGAAPGHFTGVREPASLRMVHPLGNRLQEITKLLCSF